MPTENIDSPPMVQSGDTLSNPFLDDNTDEPDDDDQLDTAGEDENNGQDFLLPDKVEREFNFVGDLDGLDLAIGFKPFLPRSKKEPCILKTRTKLCKYCNELSLHCFIMAKAMAWLTWIQMCDLGSGRSGIVFLVNDGSAIQQEPFGTDALAQIRQKMIKHWHTADVAVSRNKARAWLNVSILILFLNMGT